MNMKTLLRVCPICGSMEGEVLHTQNFILPKNSPLPNSYDITSCIKCGFTFADTPIQQKDYDLYYTLLSKYEDKRTSTGGGYNAYDLERIETAARAIEQFTLNKTARIIDIGCANGGILKILKKDGYTNLFGLDPSKKCIQEVLDAGITCKQGSILDANKVFDGEKFDFIILSHVVEHIYDLRKTFEICGQLLNKNGRLYVEVPDATHYKDFYVVPYYYFDSEHINHFDENALSNLGLSTNFSKVKAEHKIMFVSNRQEYPALFVVFEKSDTNSGRFVRSEEAKASICRYIEMSKANAESEQLQKLVESQEEIYVFGAGNFTLRLLASTDLNKCNIKAFIDNDSNKQGHFLENKPVVSPDILSDFNGTLVICSALFFEDIERQAKMINNKLNIITLK